MRRISKWLFLLLVFSLPLNRPFNLEFAEFTLPYTDIIFVVCIGFWMVSLLVSRTAPVVDRFYIFAGLYLAALAISAFGSSEPQRSLIKLAGEIYLVLLAVLALNFAREDTFPQHVSLAWLAGTLVTVLASMTGFLLFYAGYKTTGDNYFLSHYGSLPAGNYPRIHALFLNANMMCNFLNVSVVLALACVHLKWLKKPVGIVVQAGIWFAALLTLSPGIGGLLLSCSLWFHGTLRRKQRLLAKAILAAGIFGMMVFLTISLITTDTANSSDDISVPLTDFKIEPSVRVLIWKDVFRTFVQHPFIGKGVGTDPVVFRYETVSGHVQVLRDAHSVPLSILAQAGIIGFAAFAVMIAWVLKRCRFRPSAAGTVDGDLLFALSCAFAGAFLYQGLTGSFEDARHVWVLIGLIVGLSPVNSDKSNHDLT